MVPAYQSTTSSLQGGRRQYTDPGDAPMYPVECPNPEDGGNAIYAETEDRQAEQPARKSWNPKLPLDNQYGPHNPRCSERL